MRQRITFLHEAHHAIDPKLLDVGNESLSTPPIQACREDRVTFPLEDLPRDVLLALQQSHELHIRYANRYSHETLTPFISRVSSGLHVYFTPQREAAHSDLICSLLNRIFSISSNSTCVSPEKSFTTLPAQRFQHSAAYEYYLPHEEHNKYALVDYLLQLCPASDKTCRTRVDLLREADYIDIDYDSISHALNLISFWSPRTWDFSISRLGSNDRLEVGILSNEKPLEIEELNLAGFLTVVGEDTKPSPALFSFPSRHHFKDSSYSVDFAQPTGLHPSLRLSISDAKPPLDDRSCALHAHLTLPRVLFPDRYQLNDPLFLASKNISAVRHISTPVDLEAPAYVMDIWGSTMLVELLPPAVPSQSWTAEVPLHLRYLPPSGTGYTNVSIPAPVLFWACTAEEGTKFSINPFDRVNLGYEGLFGPRTMFYHLTPKAAEGAEAAIGKEGYLNLQVPVLNSTYAEWVEPGTAAVILLGFGWILWKLFLVWKNAGYGRLPEDTVTVPVRGEDRKKQ